MMPMLAPVGVRRPKSAGKRANQERLANIKRLEAQIETVKERLRVNYERGCLIADELARLLTIHERCVLRGYAIPIGADLATDLTVSTS